MTTDVYSREQRLRKRAELQSLYSNLASLRETTVASYIKASAVIPERLINQINDVRHEIEAVEHELIELKDESVSIAGHEFYRDGFKAELEGDTSKALNLYKKAARQGHPDANAAGRSLRYLIKTAKRPSTDKFWTPTTTSQSRNRLLISLAAFLILALIVVLAVSSFSSSQVGGTNTAGPATTATATLTPPAVILIVPNTATPTPLPEPTETPLPTATSILISNPTEAPSPSATATPKPTLRAAPRILEPKDGLVWGDGAIVFEFEELDLAYDELYCLNTMRGYDQTNTENWSFPPVGSKEPGIPIEAHVFRIARIQGMRCIIWSAAIGKGSCQNIISQPTEERMIGMPQPCNFNR